MKELVFNPEEAIDLVQNGIDFVSTSLGSASKFVSIIKGVKSARDAFFLKKLETFLEEYSKSSIPVRGQVLFNLKNQFGNRYFEQSLFSAIESADSEKRSALFGRLLSLCVNGEIPDNEYLNVLFVLKNVQLTDLDKLDEAVIWQTKLNKVQGEEFSEMTKVIENNIGMRTLLRFQSVALARSANVYSGSRIPFINVKFAKLVCKVLT